MVMNRTEFAIVEEIRSEANVTFLLGIFIFIIGIWNYARIMIRLDIEIKYCFEMSEYICISHWLKILN